MNITDVVWEIYRNKDEPQGSVPSRGRCLLPEVPSLGWSKSQQALPGRKRSLGISSYEIGYIDKGSIEWWLDGELHEIGPGSLFVTRPGELQGGANTLIHPCERYWLRINFPPQGDLPGLPAAVVKDLKHLFETMEQRYFPGSPELGTYFESLLEEHRKPRPFSLVMARAALSQIIVATVRSYELLRTVSYSPEVAKAINWINTHNLRDCAIEDIAKVAGLSIGYFHERFLQDVNYTPNEYLNRRRIYLAKLKLLNSTKSITEIAFDVGFSSSQYFATVFKKFVGVTPVEYRKLRGTNFAKLDFARKHEVSEVG